MYIHVYSMCVHANIAEWVDWMIPGVSVAPVITPQKILHGFC